MKSDEQLSRGFDAGNYAYAYETTDYDWAIARRSMNRSAEYIAAFTLGFFSSFEPHEMGEHQETWREALASKAGQRCLELGYIDAPEPEQSGDFRAEKSQ